MYDESKVEEINRVMESAWTAFPVYRKLSLKKRADFMRSIATEIELLGDELIAIAAQETHLPEARLKTERARTIFQLKSYADFCEGGQWLDARIDTAIPDKNPAKPGIRKTLVPLGPVVVFGASNFPFAYSTAGGDTACALAAGCPVIVKAHQAHAITSEMVAGAIRKAVSDHSLPEGVFAHVHGASTKVGEALVKHPLTKAVGFTGSFGGGKQLFDWGNERKEPIPVFAEMGSVNPVFLLPEKMAVDGMNMARQLAASITLSVGQFCTNPGIMVGTDNADLDSFVAVLAGEINASKPAPMLNTGIYKNYVEKRGTAIGQHEVEIIAVASDEAGLDEGTPTIATVAAKDFLNNPLLHQEVFGPYSLLVKCTDSAEMKEVALKLEGQLTATLIATEDDIRNNTELVDAVQNLCGRIIMNGVPTGVEVCLSMQHGGPFPATTDSRFTSVGADGIKRFARPVAYQNWSDALLPEELQDANPLGIWRTVDNKLSRDKIG